MKEQRLHGIVREKKPTLVKKLKNVLKRKREMKGMKIGKIAANELPAIFAQFNPLVL